jgi:hypothetical protein
MQDDDVGDAGGTVKPGNSLFTREWQAFWKPAGKLRGKADLEADGFAVMAITLMHLRGWSSLEDLPSSEELARIMRSKAAAIERARKRFESMPPQILSGQLKLTARWPAWIIQEFAP